MNCDGPRCKEGRVVVHPLPVGNSVVFIIALIRDCNRFPHFVLFLVRGELGYRRNVRIDDDDRLDIGIAPFPVGVLDGIRYRVGARCLEYLLASFPLLVYDLYASRRRGLRLIDYSRFAGDDFLVQHGEGGNRLGGQLHNDLLAFDFIRYIKGLCYRRKRDHEYIVLLVARALHGHCFSVDTVSFAVGLETELIFPVFDNRFFSFRVVVDLIADPVYQGTDTYIGYTVFNSHGLGRSIDLTVLFHLGAVHIKDELPPSTGRRNGVIAARAGSSGLLRIALSLLQGRSGIFLPLITAVFFSRRPGFI
ncbi:hypothetical protein D3C77_274580 [compost metagenome]